MRRLITTLAVVLAALAASAGRALADPVQSSTQSSSTGQAAIAGSSATQIQPSNQNISVRVLSPGNDGDVTQSNSASSTATATNTAATTQNAAQTQSGGCGCAPAIRSGDIGDVLGAALQAAAGQPQQAATPAPAADPAPAAPPAPSSSQTNGADSTATAANAAPTAQTGTETASTGAGVQSSTQDASTQQGAAAASSAEQDKPSNSNISVRVLSPGSDGAVTQSNDATSRADASNSATTTQGGSQTGSGGVQSSTQSADTRQGALGLSSAKQDEPANSNVTVRVLSPGNGGSVTQSNTANSSAGATNAAPVTQSDTQTQAGSPCGCAGSNGVQSATQSSWIGQGALAASSAAQQDPSNTSEPVRIGSDGNDGAVGQSNDASSTATATNGAPVTQTATQTGASACGCGSGTAVQALGQTSGVGQLAVGLSSAEQSGASNTSDPVRIGSAGGDGSTTQSNDSTSTATTTNTAPVLQNGSQTQGGSGCGCSGTAVQALGQSSRVRQFGLGLSSAEQIGADNESGPVRIGSDGSGGDVVQSNDATSTADAANNAPTAQTGTQAQTGAGIQALGQVSSVWQGALAASSAEQLPGRSHCGCGGSSSGNRAGPVRIGSDGSDGALTQSNAATSTAHAPNAALPTQTATQTQAGTHCGCGGEPVQALGQQGDVHQLAAGLGTANQQGALNASNPIRVWSPSGPGRTGDSTGGGPGGAGPDAETILRPGQRMLL